MRFSGLRLSGHVRTQTPLSDSRRAFAMSDVLTGTMADWIALWRARMDERGLTYEAMDDLADLGDRYMAKLMCGQVPNPTWRTMAKINRILLTP
jgi:hypothetical protein